MYNSALRNFDMLVQDAKSLFCTIAPNDLNTKFFWVSDDVFKENAGAIRTTPVKSPNLPAFVERVIQTLNQEVLNSFCVVNERPLDHILRVGADWYNKRRGHSGRDHLPPVRDEGDPPRVDMAKHELVCHTEFGGHLK